MEISLQMNDKKSFEVKRDTVEKKGPSRSVCTMYIQR